MQELERFTHPRTVLLGAPCRLQGVFRHTIGAADCEESWSSGRVPQFLTLIKLTTFSRNVNGLTLCSSHNREGVCTPITGEWRALSVVCYCLDGVSGCFGFGSRMGPIQSGSWWFWRTSHMTYIKRNDTTASVHVHRELPWPANAPICCFLFGWRHTIALCTRARPETFYFA